MQIHVDPLGGWSGDMFVAAVLDAFPDLWPVVQDAVETLKLGPQAQCRLVPHRDKALVGYRFVVAADSGDHGHEHTGHAHDAHHDHGDHHHHEADHAHDPDGHHHEHRAWASIRQSIQDMPLTGAIKAHAIGIFGLLAEAEAAVHGVSPDDVTFHEVGAVDSIVDIVVAAVLIDRLGATRWTSAPLPLGSGRVRTAHGILPVPAPATALLLRGLETIDDGIPGERVTPTGAAVARYLLLDRVSAVAAPRRLSATGTGFGTRSMPGISNCLRMLAFEEIQAERPSVGLAATFGHRELAVLEFEVDDQSAEDLTHGLDHLRAAPGVHDVIQSVAFGKKGRMATHVQVLVAPEQRDAVIAACFEETTTIGLRYHAVHGAALVRRFDRVEVEGHQLQVKMVTRPSGVMTGKTEAADVAAQLGHATRARLRHAGEAGALARAGSTDRPADGDR